MWGPSIRANWTDDGWFTKKVNPWLTAKFGVVVCLTFPDHETAPSLADAAKYFAKVAKAAAGLPIKFEIGNEWNLDKYCSFADADDWASRCVAYTKVAREQLKGYYLVGVPVTYGDSNSIVLDKAKALVGAGILNYVDAMGLHAYSRNAADMVTKVVGVKKLIGSKPLIITENNVATSDADKWGADIGPALDAISPYVAEHYYYRTYSTNNGSTLGPYCPYTPAGKRSDAFDTVRAALTSSVTVPTPEPVPDKPEQPTPTPAPTSYKVSGLAAVGATVRIVDAKGNTVVTKEADAHGWWGTNKVAPGSYTVQVVSSAPITVVDKDVVVK